MLEIAAILLVIVWLLGVLASYTWGGWIHVLLVAAAVAIVVRLFEDRPPK